MITRHVLANVIRRLVAPLTQRVRLMIGRGVVKLVDDSYKCQKLQAESLSDVLRDDLERFQEYGYTSVPFADDNTECIILAIGGNTAHGVVICASDRTRRPLNLNEGDVCLFTDKGERVYLNRDDDVVHVGAKIAAAWIARADYTDARITALQQAHDTHIHTTTATIGPSAAPGVISLPTVTAGAQDTVAATKAKVT